MDMLMPLQLITNPTVVVTMSMLSVQEAWTDTSPILKRQ